MKQNKDKTSEIQIDTSKLSLGSLKKYQVYFKIPCDDSELSEQISKHFNDELIDNIDPKQVLDKFLKLKKEETDDGNNKRPTTRKKPKLI